MVNEHRMSERHACALVELSRDTYCHVGKRSALNAELRDQIIQTAQTRRHWGYRMIHDVLRAVPEHQSQAGVPHLHR